MKVSCFFLCVFLPVSLLCPILLETVPSIFEYFLHLLTSFGCLRTVKKGVELLTFAGMVFIITICLDLIVKLLTQVLGFQQLFGLCCLIFN